MVFNSIQFLVFFPIVVGVYYLIPAKARKFWLLFASYYFYMSWNAVYSLLILTSTVVTYFSGILLAGTENVKRRKWIVAGSFIVNLGILFFFKYFDFLISNVNVLLGAVKLGRLENPFSIILPVGISFYTFQALSYTVDCYRKDIPVEKNFVNYALFVSFFPQLVAGPIERSGNLLSQVNNLDRKKLFTYEKAVSGFSMMCMGMFMKMVIADNLAVFVDGVWNNLYKAGTVATLAAAIAFSLQIYCDFGGYSAIAIGAARMMGFNLCENFNTPYFATSVADFWRRWHISLSTWFRDYLYIPLGGSRCSKAKKYRNVMITMLVSGLWHGANWTYVIWGGIHGLYQVMGDVTKKLREKICTLLKIDTSAESFTIGKIFVTFCFTTFAWIFFKAKTLSEAVLFIKTMVTKPDPWVLFDGSLYGFGTDVRGYHILLFAVMILLIVDYCKLKKQMDFGEFMVKQNLWFRWLTLIALVVFCVVFGAYGVEFDSAAFIYFQF